MPAKCWGIPILASIHSNLVSSSFRCLGEPAQEISMSEVEGCKVLNFGFPKCVVGIVLIPCRQPLPEIYDCMQGMPVESKNITILSLLVVVAYAAVCMTVYIYTSLWAGTAAVVATVLLLAVASINAYRHRNSSQFAFALSALAWLAFWFSFYGQAPTGSRSWELGPFFSWIAQAPAYIGRSDIDGHKYDPTQPSSPFGRMESIHLSLEMRYQGNALRAPYYHNSTRLGVCMTSLVFGLAVGAVAKACSYRRRRS